MHKTHHVTGKIHAGNGVDQLSAVQIKFERTLDLVVTRGPIDLVHGNITRDLGPLVGIVSSEHDKLQKGISLTFRHEFQADIGGIDQAPQINLEPPVAQRAIRIRLPIGRFVPVEQIGDSIGV